MFKFLLQRFLGDSLRHAVLRGLQKSRLEKLKLENPADMEQISFNVMEQVAIESEKGIQGAKRMVGDLNKVQKKRTSRFKP
jgi:hypothetical protein